MQQCRALHCKYGENRMNNELIRLSDLVPDYARYHNVSFHEAAYSLHELMEDLWVEYSVLRRIDQLPERLFWVGRVSSEKPSNRGYELDYDALLGYFKGLRESLPGTGSSLIKCFCNAVRDYKDIPVSAVYSSRAALGKWILDAGIEAPNFILDGHADKQAREDNEGGELQVKELNSIGLIINGLINLIKEVDKAHAEQVLDEAAGKRADTIKRRALGLRSQRKNFDLCSAILSLADVAGVDMPKSHKTVRKYMGDYLPRSADEFT